MATININKREVVRIKRNGRADESTSFLASSTFATGGTIIDWAEVTPDLVTINRDLKVTGNITATEDVIAYVADAVTSDVLNALSVSTPLQKMGTNIQLNVNPTQFNFTGNTLNYIGSGGSTGSVNWVDVQNKPSFAIVATTGSYTDLINKPNFTSTISGATDNGTYFTGTKALTAAVADSANAVAWGNVSNKPTSFTPTAHSHIISDVTGLQTALDGKLATTLKGAVNGLAELDASGFVKNAQLPSYVDDVIEYGSFAALPATGVGGKIYITTDNNKTFRWSGSVYAEISASLALGVTSSTAYRGDFGNTAYNHSQLTHDKTLVGLSNVDNTSDASKPVSTATQTALNLKVDKLPVITYTTPASANWYRVASQTGSNTCYGNFIIKWNNASTEGEVILNVGTSKGATPTLNQIHYVNTGNNITKARIVYTNYSGSVYSHLEIYQSVSTATNISVQLNEATDFTLITPVAGSVPSYHSAYEISFLQGLVADKNVSAQSFVIKNASNAVQWTVTLNGTDLVFTNASGVKKAKIDQSGNLIASGDVVAFGVI